ncbi:MAG: hypothetical protein ACJ0PP_00615 [Flavobacteriaceae bacterium]
MVINNSNTFFSMIDDFDPNDKVLLENIVNVLNQYPNFQLLRVLCLKSIKSQNSKDFDKALSHASISTFDRELLYEFLDTDIIPNKIKEEQIDDKVNKNIKEKIIIENDSAEDISVTKEMEFYKWFSYIKSNKTLNDYSEVEKKFALIDNFLNNKKRIDPDRNLLNTEDLSEKSIASQDELMTETLAKVLIKQKKYDKALEAYQILGLKYPEKNSFFADQIKKIHKLQKMI